MNEREEIELLLPWYATGKLDAEDQRRVETYLANHRDLDDQLALVREDRDDVIALNEQMPTPSAGGLDRLLARVDAEEPDAGRKTVSFFQGLKDLFGEYGSPGLKLAAVSLVVLFVAQSVAITSLLTETAPGGTYQTASGVAPDALARLPSLVLETELQLKGDSSDPDAALCQLVSQIVKMVRR